VTTFLLLHGGGHGGWCFARLEPLLRARGHGTVAVDLPYDDAAVSLAELGARLRAAAAGIDDHVVAVGHSMGGLLLPMAADAANVRALVLLCAVVPEPGRSFAEQNLEPLVAAPSTVPPDALVADAQGLRRFRSREALRTHLYQDCDAATVDWAWERCGAIAAPLGRDPSPVEAWPDRPTTSIVCAEDRAVAPAFSHAAAARIGATVVELPGSHSPFASRPEALAAVLAAVPA